MSDEKDVKSTDSSSEETKDVNDTGTDTSQAEKVEHKEATADSGQESAKFDPNFYDEGGVPWKNRFHEQKRKFEDVMDKLPEMIEQKLTKALPKTKEPEPTFEQLEAFKLEHPEHTPWIESRKEDLRLKKMEELLSSKLELEKRSREAESQKGEALNYVFQSYPQAFAKGQDGKPNGWDSQSPLAMEIARVYETYGGGVLKANPMGLAAAADIAFGLVSRKQVAQTQGQVSKAKAEAKKLQQKTMVEGTGVSSNADEAPTVKKAVDKAKTSGRVSDVENALKEMFKARGII